jgi:seryl-tRNA synthetase
MTDKQIDIVEKLGEWSQELVLKEDDTISLNLIGLDIYIKGVCTKDNIYFPASELNCIINRLIEKEQECEELKKIIDEAKNSKLDLNSFFAIEATVGEYQLELDQLKAEVKSKTEYIQEQRDIINQYSKEIEMYKKCQGKRASKREEELKAENGELKNRVAELSLFQLYKIQRDEAEQTLTEIKEIAERDKEFCDKCDGDREIDCVDCHEGGRALLAQEILQKISEVEDGQ